MNLVIPEFAEAIHYRELRGSSEESQGKYRFKLIQDVALAIPALTGHTARISFRDVQRTEWARLEGGTLTIRRGYAWNGASPKWWFLGHWLGTPDPEPTRLATLFHDVCFQFLRTADWPIDLGHANDLFEALMLARGFRWAGLYHGAVVDFGERFAGAYPKQGEHSFILS